MISPSALFLGDMKLLPKCAVYIRLLKLVPTVETCDHDVALCEVDGTGIWDESLQKVVMTELPPEALDLTMALYTAARLQAKGIIIRRSLLRVEPTSRI